MVVLLAAVVAQVLSVQTQVVVILVLAVQELRLLLLEHL
jgi:hypothetical protein